MYAKVIRRACVRALRPRPQQDISASAWPELRPGVRRAARVTLRVDYGVDSPTVDQVRGLILKLMAEAKCDYLESLIDS